VEVGRGEEEVTELRAALGGNALGIDGNNGVEGALIREKREKGSGGGEWIYQFGCLSLFCVVVHDAAIDASNNSSSSR